MDQVEKDAADGLHKQVAHQKVENPGVAAGFSAPTAFGNFGGGG